MLKEKKTKAKRITNKFSSDIYLKDKNWDRNK